MWFYVVAKLINVFYFCKSVFVLLFFLCAINLRIKGTSINFSFINFIYKAIYRSPLKLKIIRKTIADVIFYL